MGLSQHPPVQRSVLHISDTHLLADSQRLYGSLDTSAVLSATLNRVASSGVSIDAVVFTGDLADIGQPGAYRDLRSLVEPVVDSLGAQLVWVMGNHDEPEPFARELWDQGYDGSPLDRVYDVNGLRVIALDTSVPGFHHGELSDNQHRWLAKQLSTPAELGTLLALHHPPIPTPIEMMGVIELEDQPRLWQTIAGSDVRGILAGHLHYSSFSTFQGIPVSVAAAMCYNIDLLAPRGTLLGAIDGGQMSSLVSVYPDQVVFSEVSALDMPGVFTRTDELIDEFRQWPPAQRRAVFSDKNSAFNRGEQIEQAGQ